ncbi:plus-3-domain-containing protein [Leucogyrophana mollusca]|uniref:Plus-3-domain-containing protein n=1 Tax=Leucogyrophana mollusca TaxID=85980 RepID=A0ACB8B0W7_9AGAM|nr:plus-3-domain-containing protein [Leucogyrophana mollusca]
MSDSEGDFSDELLELAGATEKKRRKRQTSSSKPSAAKKRKTNVSVDSDSEPELESEQEEANPYPLDGKYIDEADREELLSKSEIEREEILAQRSEEMQRIQDKRNLDAMLKAQKERPGDSDSIAKTAKRQHAQRGATKEKTRTLAELKARRKAKDEKKRTKTNSPKRDRSDSPMDMETSSGEEEDGQITKYEEEEEKDRKLYTKTNPDDEPISLEDLATCRLTRDMLVKHCMAPWFEDYVKGGWVRYLIGQEGSQPVYRICEIQNLGANLAKPYKINEVTVNQTLDLKHGKSVKSFNMDKVSNSAFIPREFDRLKRTCAADDVKLPTKRHLEKKVAQLSRLVTQNVTESDITAMLARKNQLSNGAHSAAALTLERSRLMQAKTLAIRRQDYTEVAEIDAKLAELPVPVNIAREEENLSDRLAKVNERNRKANLEAVRKAEILESERKRRDRKLAAAGASGTATPTDPSARLKVLPRTFNSTSRSGTPNINSAGTPLPSSDVAGARSISPLPPPSLSGPRTSPEKIRSLEVSVIESIEVDLGDF